MTAPMTQTDEQLREWERLGYPNIPELMAIILAARARLREMEGALRVDVRAIAKAQLKRMREAGESHEMCARWIAEEVNLALVQPAESRATKVSDDYRRGFDDGYAQRYDESASPPVSQEPGDIDIAWELFGRPAYEIYDALRAARASGMERAAKIAQQWTSDNEPIDGRVTAEAIVTAIREAKP